MTARWEIQRSRSKQPVVIDLTLFRQAVFQVGLGINSAYFLAFGSVLFVMTFTLQEGLHESAELSGLTFVPQGAAFALASLIGARLASRLGPRLVTVGACASSTACALLFVQANDTGIAAGPRHLLPFMALLGAGNGLAIPAMIASVLRVVPRATSGTAAGVLTATQQISMAFGVAIFGSVQDVVTAPGPAPRGYLAGLGITPLMTAVLLALAAVASTSLYRRQPVSSGSSLPSSASTAASVPNPAMTSITLAPTARNPCREALVHAGRPRIERAAAATSAAEPPGR